MQLPPLNIESERLKQHLVNALKILVTVALFAFLLTRIDLRLVGAIIAQAYQDAHSSRPSLAHPARQWFKTQDFKNYLRWLDIPETARPQLQEDQTVTTKPHDVGDILVSIVNQIAKRDGVDFNRAYATLAQERPDVLQTYTDARRTEEDIERLKKVITR